MDWPCLRLIYRMAPWVEHVRIAVHRHGVWSVPGLVRNLIASHGLIHYSIFLGMEVLSRKAHQIILSDSWYSVCRVLHASSVAVPVELRDVVISPCELGQVTTCRGVSLHTQKFILHKIGVCLLCCHHLPKLVRLRLWFFLQGSQSHTIVWTNWW